MRSTFAAVKPVLAGCIDFLVNEAAEAPGGSTVFRENAFAEVAGLLLLCTVVKLSGLTESLRLDQATSLGLCVSDTLSVWKFIASEERLLRVTVSVDILMGRLPFADSVV